MSRLLEPSTWAGFAGIAGALAHLLPGSAGMALGAIGAGCGGVAVFLRERSA